MKPALPYLPHELDRHADRDRIRATIAEDIAGAVEGVETGAVELGALQAEIDGALLMLGAATKRLREIAAGIAAGCLEPHEMVEMLERLAEDLEGDGA